MDKHIQDGLDIILREGRGCRPKDRTWKRHKELVDQARAHIEACGADFDDYLPAFKRQLAEVMKL